MGVTKLCLPVGIPCSAKPFISLRTCKLRETCKPKTWSLINSFRTIRSAFNWSSYNTGLRPVICIFLNYTETPAYKLYLAKKWLNKLTLYSQSNSNLRGTFWAYLVFHIANCLPWSVLHALEHYAKYTKFGDRSSVVLGINMSIDDKWQKLEMHDRKL